MRKFWVLLVVPALLLGACGGGGDDAAEEDPKGTLTTAFENLGKADAQEVTLSLQSTADSLTALSEGELDEEMAEKILGSSITVAGEETDDPSSARVRLAFDVEGTEGAEILVLGEEFYARADVRGLAEAFGQDDAAVDQLVQQAESQGVDFLGPAVEGEYLRLEGAKDLFKQFGAQPQEATAQQERLAAELGDAIKDDAEVTSEGEDDVGAHLVMTASVRDLYSHFMEFADELGTVPTGTLPPKSEVPEGDLSLDAWVEDDRLVQLEFDLLQLQQFEDAEDFPEGVEELAIRLELEEDFEAIEAPEDAVTVTQAELQQIVAGAMGAGSSATGRATGVAPPGGAGGIDCASFDNLPPEALEGLPPGQLEQLEALCPGIAP